MPVDLRLGVDVGHTNTDAAVLDAAGAVIATAKIPTSADITSGIERAIHELVLDPAVQADRIGHAMVGTTHAHRAIVERTGLERVGVLRIGAPATLAVPPLACWPKDLRDAVSAGVAVVQGGIDISGEDALPFEADLAARFFEELCGQVDAVAITSVFATVSERHELAAADVARAVLGDVRVSLSHPLGAIGIIERENATVLNAALGGVARRVAGAVDLALRSHGLAPSIFFAQHDGTLMALDYALDHPVLTIGSGAGNSLRGAVHLTGASDAIVADVGGTTAELGALANGYPRRCADSVAIGGVRCDLPLTELVSLDLADSAPLEPRLHEAVERIMLAPEELPLVALGGAAELVPDELPGVAVVARPRHHAVANAIGAAVAEVGGCAERIVHYRRLGRDAAVEAVCAIARKQVIRAGADPTRTQIVEVEEIPVTYLTDAAVRVRVRANGPIGVV